MAPEEIENKANENRAQAGRRKPAAGMIRVKLVRSIIGSSPRQRKVVAGLGLRRMNQVVERQDTREIRGMVAKVSHLVRVVP